jgi:hypothetical protein
MRPHRERESGITRNTSKYTKKIENTIANISVNCTINAILKNTKIQKKSFS